MALSSLVNKDDESTEAGSIDGASTNGSLCSKSNVDNAGSNVRVSWAGSKERVSWAGSKESVSSASKSNERVESWVGSKTENSDVSWAFTKPLNRQVINKVKRILVITSPLLQVEGI